MTDQQTPLPGGEASAAHPEFQLEAQRLADTQDAITRLLADLGELQLRAADDWASDNLKRLNAARMERFKMSSSNPYFGRVDFSPAETGPDEEYFDTGLTRPSEGQAFYLGYQGLPLGPWEVLDWRSPAGRLFYSGVAEEQTYRTPEGPISGRLLLKRRLNIEAGELLQVLDEIDRRPGHAQADLPPEAMVSEEAYLLQVLARRGDPRLQDIVRTIQQQQDRIIRAPAEKVVIINGVAGSGKTSIAYHRLAYLLYPDNETGILPQRTLVIGPNRLFLSYVASLLPGLGVRDVRQVTFDDWALEQMGLAFYQAGVLQRKVRVVERALQVFLDRRSAPAERQVHWRRARLKGSPPFQRLLEAFVARRRAAFQPPPAGLVYRDLGDLKLTLGLTAAEMQAVFDQVAQGEPAFHQLRAEVVLRLENLLESKYERLVQGEYERRLHRGEEMQHRALRNADPGLAEQAEALLDAARQFRNQAFTFPNLRRRVIDRAVALLRLDLERLWPDIDVRRDYYRLLADSATLQLCSQDSGLDSQDLALLGSHRTGDEIQAEPVIDLEDLPALHYLHVLVRGAGPAAYDHIVIDEAQDFSPLQVSVLRRHSRQDSFTILGDLSQGIYAHRGLADWGELAALFPRGRLQREQISQNYRSTREIILFCNALLRSVLGPDAPLAQPFNRPGRPPRLVESSGREAMLHALAADIRSLQAGGLRQLGLLVKSEADCAPLVAWLSSRDIPARVVLSRDEQIDYAAILQGGGLLVLPVPLAKGIEFQAALVVDADEETYSAQVEYDGRLLYVAATRALHFLGLYASGPASAFLDDARQFAELAGGSQKS